MRAPRSGLVTTRRHASEGHFKYRESGRARSISSAAHSLDRGKLGNAETEPCLRSFPRRIILQRNRIKGEFENKGTGFTNGLRKSSQKPHSP